MRRRAHGAQLEAVTAAGREAQKLAHVEQMRERLGGGRRKAPRNAAVGIQPQRLHSVREENLPRVAAAHEPVAGQGRRAGDRKLHAGLAHVQEFAQVQLVGLGPGVIRTGAGTVDKHQRRADRRTTQQRKILLEAEVRLERDGCAVRRRQKERRCGLGLPPKIVAAGADVAGVDVERIGLRHRDVGPVELYGAIGTVNHQPAHHQRVARLDRQLGVAALAGLAIQNLLAQRGPLHAPCNERGCANLIERDVVEAPAQMERGGIARLDVVHPGRDAVPPEIRARRRLARLVEVAAEGAADPDVAGDLDDAAGRVVNGQPCNHQVVPRLHLQLGQIALIGARKQNPIPQHRAADPRRRVRRRAESLERDQIELDGRVFHGSSREGGRTLARPA